MLGWIILIVALVAIIIGFLVYKQESSKFTKSTNYSLIDIWTKPDVKKASYFLEQLDRVDGEHEVLLNVDVPFNNTTLHADAVLIHESGVYILTSVYKKGWINGHEYGQDWVEVQHGNKKTEFENPLFYNLRIMHSMQKMLPDLERHMFKNIVVFGGGCSFQNIGLVTNYVEVLKLGEVKAWKNTLSGSVLEKSEMDLIYQTLKDYSYIKKEPKQKSKQSVALS